MVTIQWLSAWYYFLNCDLWLKDIIFLHKVWVFFLVINGMVPLFLSYKKFSIFTLKMKKYRLLFWNMKQLMNSGYISLITFLICCCIYFSNLICFLFFSVTLAQVFNNKWKEWIGNSEWCRSGHKKQIKVESVRLVFRSLFRFVLLFDFSRLKHFTYYWWVLTIWKIMSTLLSMSKLKK